MRRTFSFICIAAIFLLFTLSISAQTADAVSAQQEAIKKIGFLVGSWHGSGWIMFGPQKRQTFTIDETVQMKLDGSVVLIEDIGKSDGKVVHNALGLLSYDAEKQKYSWEAFTKMGRIETAPEISTNKFVWGFSNPQMGGEVRYTIVLNEKSNWLETGEFSRDGGKTWWKNFEMELQKVK